MQHQNTMIEKEPIYDEVGRRLKGKDSCPPYNKRNPTNEDMDEYFLEV